MQIAASLLAKGQMQHDINMSDPSRGISDPVITPFVLAMKIGGYTELLKSRCSILRACPHCPVGASNYSQQYEMNGTKVWACPHCQTITEN